MSSLSSIIEQRESELHVLRDIQEENETLRKKVSKVLLPKLGGTHMIVRMCFLKHFKRFGIDYDVFEKIFSKDVVLSGSVVLMQLVGERWFSDIDLVITQSSLQNVQGFLMHNYGVYIDKVEQEDYPKHTELYRGKHHCGVSIDVIVVSGDFSIADVVKTFDLSFCRNYFDGTEVVCFDEKSVATKTHIGMNIAQQYRIDKYRQRGFTVKSDEECCVDNDDISYIQRPHKKDYYDAFDSADEPPEKPKQTIKKRLVKK